MPHTITLSRPLYSPIQELNYACYKNKNYAFRFDNVRDRYDFLLSNNLLGHEQCTPSFMINCIDLLNSNWCMKHFLDILGEDKIPEYIKIYAAKKDYDGNILSLLKQPSARVITTALTTAGQNLIHLSNPTTQQILLGLSHETETPWLITKIKHPTVKMQITAVTHDIQAYKYITNPCESVKLAAARAHGIEILRYIKSPSEQVILTAIRHTLDTTGELLFYFLPHPNHKIYNAIKQQINSSKHLISTKPQEQISAKTLQINSWQNADVQHCQKLAKIKQEMTNFSADMFLIPTR